MIEVNAMGDACPIPVVKTKKAIAELGGAGEVKVSVDNEIAVQNIQKMAQQKGYESSFVKKSDAEYEVTLVIGEGAAAAADADEEEIVCDDCAPKKKKNTVVVFSKDYMGEGSEELGRMLLPKYIYSLTQLEELPTSLIFFNGGAKLACKGSECLDDIKALAAAGVNVLVCGTCLNYYELVEDFEVGSVSNMYEIVETMSKADLVMQI
jgi:selenium metabolism protein YedF